MKRLIDWARRQKQRGILKYAYRVYIWSKHNVMWVIYQRGVAFRPDWENGHYALGTALKRRYSYLSELKSRDASQTARVSWSEIIDLGNRATDHFRKALDINPEKLERYEGFLSLLYELGRTDEASIGLQQFADLKSSLAEMCQEDRLALRFVPTGIAKTIGVLGNLDGYVKAGLLGWRRPHKIIMLLPDEASVGNRCFLDYWRKYITVISDPKMIEVLSPLINHLEDPINWSLSCNGQALFMTAAKTLVQKQWDAENRPPLMTLSTSDHERGWQCLEGLGVPKDSWFACLHVREPGFKDRDSRYDSYRNADIDTYMSAIQTIVAQGGWVIRMGDSTMKPLPAMDHVIDYAHSDVRSDWMDVFLCAQCHFFIGTSSGLYLIAIAFGTPIVQTNYLPLSTLWLSSEDLFLPRLLWSIKEQRLLNFVEILAPLLSAGVNQSSYDRLNVKILDNTPEEINDIVSEMLLRLDGNLTYSASDERLQERLQSLTAACGTLLGHVVVD